MNLNPPKQQAGLCVFCGRSGSLSKQHIFPNRLRRLLPRDAINHTGHLINISYADNTTIISPELPKTKNGHLGTKQLRIVCRECNAGWMNDIEKRSFVFIEPMIAGLNVLLDSSAQQALASFCAIFFSVADREHVPTSGIGQKERTYVFENRKPPTTWNLFIGRTNSNDWRFRFKHHGMTIGSSTSGIPIPPKNNSQVCTAGFGGLLFHAISNGNFNIIGNVSEYERLFGLGSISPISDNFNFHDLPVHDTESSNKVSDGLVFSLPRVPPRY